MKSQQEIHEWASKLLAKIKRLQGALPTNEPDKLGPEIEAFLNEPRVQGLMADKALFGNYAGLGKQLVLTPLMRGQLARAIACFLAVVNDLDAENEGQKHAA